MAKNAVLSLSVGCDADDADLIARKVIEYIGLHESVKHIEFTVEYFGSEES